MKPDISSVEVHPQLSYITVNPVDDGALGGDVLLPDWTPTQQLYMTIPAEVMDENPITC